MTEGERALWLKERMKGIGASDAPAILGLSPYMTPLGVYLTKVGEWEPGDSTEKASGRKLEAVVAEMYAEETGRTVVPSVSPITWHPDLPWMFCSIDRVAFPVVGEKHSRIVEIKTSRYAEEYGDEGTEEIPDMVMAQVQHQLACTDLSHADVALLVGGQEFRIYPIERNQNFIDGMIPVLGEFWKKVEERTPPEFDWTHPATPGLVKDLYAKVTEGKVRYLEGQDLSLLLVQHEALTKQIQECKRYKEWLVAKLHELVGDTALTLTPYGKSIRKKTVERKGYWVDPTTYTQLTVIDERPHDSISRAKHHHASPLLGSASSAGADFEGSSLDDESDPAGPPSHYLGAE